MPGRASRKEKRWALVWALIIVGLTCLPYLIAWPFAPADALIVAIIFRAQEEPEVSISLGAI